MIGSVYPALILQNCKRLLLLPCQLTLGLSKRMTHQPSGAEFERPRYSGVEESKGFDPPNASSAQPRVPLGAMSPNTPARPRRRSAEQRFSEYEKIVRCRKQSRVQGVVEERQRAEKARARQQARTQQQIRAQETRNSRLRQNQAERQETLTAYKMEEQQQ